MYVRVVLRGVGVGGLLGRVEIDMSCCCCSVAFVPAAATVVDEAGDDDFLRSRHTHTTAERRTYLPGVHKEKCEIVDKCMVAPARFL